MPNPITTIEFRFDQDKCSKDGNLFQGPMELLILPEVGTVFTLDRPAGVRGRIVSREVMRSGRVTEIIFHCQLLDSNAANIEKGTLQRLIHLFWKRR